MITVIDFEDKRDCQILDISDLTGDNYNEEKNAFIGQCGDGPSNALYIVAYDNIILAKNPRKNWSSPCDVHILRFVDIDILVKEKEEKQ